MTVPIVPGIDARVIEEIGCNREAKRSLAHRKAPIGTPVPEHVVLGEMAEGETDSTVRLEMVVGEMGTDLESLVPAKQDVAAIKAGDDDPLEVVVSIEAGKSTKGIHYTEAALGEIANAVNANGLPGYLGHMKPDEINHKFNPPVTHWVGAVQKGKQFLFRGVVDAAAKDLKRWIRAKRITQPSIFGIAKLRPVLGELRTAGFEPISIDWAPLGRAGMQSAQVVALGEMDSIAEPGKEPPTGDGNERKRRGSMDLQEWIAEGRALRPDAKVVVGEMGLGLRTDDVVSALGLELRTDDDKALTKVVGEMIDSLGIDGDTEEAKRAALTKRIGELVEIDRTQRTESHRGSVSKVVGEMVAHEPAREFVTDLAVAKLAQDADEATIKKVVGEITETDHVKTAIAGMHKGGRTPAPKADATRGGSAGGTETNGDLPGARRRKVRVS